MRRFLAFLLVLSLWLGVAPAAFADGNVARLAPCGEVSAFNQRLDNQVRTLETSLQQYAPDSGSASMLKKQIKGAKSRANRYAGFLCGSDGLPRLIVDGRPNHWGEFQIPSLLFIYLTCWLGWAARSYIRAVKDTDQPELREVQIDYSLALRCFTSALLWPLAVVQEILSGDLQEQEGKFPVSIR
ncbi:MAG TPA: hypothetical protein V6D03_06765 [Candidatus Caenarcaniphilales bacterium]